MWNYTNCESHTKQQVENSLAHVIMGNNRKNIDLILQTKKSISKGLGLERGPVGTCCKIKVKN